MLQTTIFRLAFCLIVNLSIRLSVVLILSGHAVSPLSPQSMHSAPLAQMHTYHLSFAPAPQQFAISFGDTISNGVPAPGAGNLEVPGAVDIYTFDALTARCCSIQSCRIGN